MKKMTYAAVIFGLGLIGTFSNAFGQGETPNPADTKAGYASAVSSPSAGETKAPAPDAANGSVEV